MIEIPAHNITCLFLHIVETIQFYTLCKVIAKVVEINIISYLRALSVKQQSYFNNWERKREREKQWRTRRWLPLAPRTRRLALCPEHCLPAPRLGSQPRGWVLSPEALFSAPRLSSQPRGSVLSPENRVLALGGWDIKIYQLLLTYF